MKSTGGTSNAPSRLFMRLGATSKNTAKRPKNGVSQDRASSPRPRKEGVKNQYAEKE
eukprot:CAMPEP_0179184958 /NCGR_PEP_ID=MMETSP0796-20121207/91711_1 /TAXON_ID=73915 /ORGANISM="Pyrodinium bahamense, Strain pbaha01" /LENGTH=56 /DNA_ID=CAMNT_0020888911 /DNA_START=213 /DNA_END=383 /DNA_ORIENTATION=-